MLGAASTYCRERCCLAKYLDLEASHNAFFKGPLVAGVGRVPLTAHAGLRMYHGNAKRPLRGLLICSGENIRALGRFGTRDWTWDCWRYIQPPKEPGLLVWRCLPPGLFFLTGTSMPDDGGAGG